MQSITKQGGKGCSHQDGFMDTGLQARTTSLLLQVSQVRPLGTLPVAPEPPDQPLRCVPVYTLFLSTLLLPGAARARAVLESAISPSSPGSFYWEKALEPEHWALGASRYWGIIPFRALQTTEQGDACVRSYHVHTHTSVKVSACNRVCIY